MSRHHASAHRHAARPAPQAQRLEDRRLLDAIPVNLDVDSVAVVAAPHADDDLDAGLRPDILTQGVPELFITIGDAQARSVRFTDADGTRIAISHRIGTAVVQLVGTHLEQDIGQRDIVVTGADIQIISITYDQTSLRSRTVINTSNAGDGATSIETITGESPVGKLIAPDTHLVGQGIVMTGLGVIASVTLGNVENGADIIMPGNGPRRGITLRLKRIDAGTTIDLASDVRRLSADSWLDGAFTATAARTIHIGGNVSGDWVLATDGARSVFVGGSVLSGAWTFAGPMRSFTIRRSFAGEVTATSYRKIIVREDFTGSIAATATGGTAIRKLHISGESTGARISTIADVQKMKLGPINGLEIYVGLPLDWAGGLPTSAADLVRSSRVKKLQIRGDTAGATFVAGTFKKLDMRNILDTATFSLAGEHVRRASMRIEGRRYHFGNDRIFSEAPVRPYLNFQQLT
ncbi:MAG: hypothetical protein KAS72_05405 [Phycisphaerales bacterium]|nr:hypothetical protein [Phycisphaerales bacterium]